MTQTSSVFVQVCADCRFATAFHYLESVWVYPLLFLHAVFIIFFVRIACVSFSRRVFTLWAPCRTGWESAGGCSIFFCQLRHLRDAMLSSTTTAAHTLLTPEIHEAHFSFNSPTLISPFSFLSPPDDDLRMKISNRVVQRFAWRLPCPAVTHVRSCFSCIIVDLMYIFMYLLQSWICAHT